MGLVLSFLSASIFAECAEHRCVFQWPQSFQFCFFLRGLLFFNCSQWKRFSLSFTGTQQKWHHSSVPNNSEKCMEVHWKIPSWWISELVSWGFWSWEMFQISSNPRDKCQMYLSLSFLIFVFFFSKQNLTLCFASINWLFSSIALGMKTNSSMTYPALQKQLHTKRFN